MHYALRLTEDQYSDLRSHLFPGDGDEAIALLLCGRRNGNDRHILTVQDVLLIPHDQCNRTPVSVEWATHFLDDFIAKAYKEQSAIIKVHSHPTGYSDFSSTDDASDNAVFASLWSLLENDLPHGSIVMLPDGSLFGRMMGDGTPIGFMDSIMVIGHDIKTWNKHSSRRVESFAKRHAQAFGSGTTEILRSFSIAIVGCSGTGSVVVELLARLGVGRLVLVDPDVVEEKNLNRILNSGKEDAYLGRPKVHVLASAIAHMGLGTEVVPIHADLATQGAVLSVAECDIVFGCMDGAEGRHLLNRLAAYYSLAYFDVGVRLDADGKGGIDGIYGAVHYLQPGLSTLLSREVYTMAQVEAEEMRRVNPELYKRRIKEGYLKGVLEDRPAVISINTLYASLCVNEFLARIHPYRNNTNSQYSVMALNLGEMQFYPEKEEESKGMYFKYLGKGDTSPLLGRPSLS